MMPDLRKTILLVENDAKYALHEAEQIKTRGFNVVTANDGETAVGIVEKGPKIDLVIMGLDLGSGIDGIQAAEMILQSHDLPLLFLAGHLEPETMDKIEKLSHYGLILKSVGDAVLFSSINMAFRLHNTHLESKIREQLLRESEEKYRLVIETMQDGVYRSSHEGKFLEVNPAMVKILGYDSKEELLAIDIKSQLYFAPEDRESAEKLGEMGAFRLRKKDGSEIWVEDHGLLVVDDEGTVLYHEGVLRDITERKQLEERIRQTRTDLLFAVSHDLKTPLMVLNQSQEMLSILAPGEALARFQEYRQIWRRNLQRLERMINNLVDSQRSEEGCFPLLLAPCRLEEMVKRVVEDSQAYAQAKQVEVQLGLQPVPESSCDEEAIGRVVENLLTNAVKFSPKGGQVEIRLGMEGDTLRLEVEDRGCGIPKTEQAQLFQPFQRGRSAHQKGIPGTGLGLYVCRRIVEEHGGTIAMTSEEGKGTKVTVRLPWRVQ